MAEKKIVELNQSGVRVKELLDQIDTTYETTKNNAEAAITKADSVEATVSDLNTVLGNQEVTIRDHENRISAVEAVAASYDLTYSDDMLRLRQTKGDITEVVSEVKIVSASDVASSVITINRITSASSTVTLKEPGVIEYEVSSLQDGVETGDLTVTWKVNNRTVLTETVKQGRNTFKLEGNVSAGYNSITATFVDSIGTSYPTRWSVDVIDMYITSTFDDTTIYSGVANVSFTPYGVIEKTVYLILNGEKIYEEKISTSGVQTSYSIPHKSHGAYSLEIYCKATMNNGKEIESPHLYYDVMFVDQDNTTPIIRWPYDGSNLTQYKPKTFEYSVYTPNSLTSSVELYINNEKISEQTVDRTEQEWVYKPLQSGENIEFKIKTGNIEKTKILSVEKIPYNVDPIANAAFDFNPVGRSNNDINYDTWTDGKYSMSVSDGFDWVNGGWKTDDKKDSYFCVKAGSRMTLNFPLFEALEDTKKTGKNFKFIFKTTNNRAIKDTAISCLTSKEIEQEDGTKVISKIGVNIGTQEANLYAATKELEVQYVENEKLELEFNIQPDAERKSLILGYLDADPVRVVQYDTNASFNSAEYEQKVPITIGSDTCDVHIYRIKCYHFELSDKDIMQNFIADATNSDEMIARYERNDILDTTGEELDYNKLSKEYPNLRIILITCPRFTFDKDDKVKGCTVQHIMGNGDPMHNWTATNVQLKGQGTSSNEYGTSARNMDIKLNKVKINGVEQDYAFTYGDNKTTGAKYAMTENSVPVNYFNIKVNVASSENANNARLAERFFRFNPYVRQVRIDDPRVRDTMEFHPCVIFLKELGQDTEYGNQEFEDTTKFHFYACGDFGNSKKNHEAFGMDLDSYEDYLKAAKEQNTDTPVDEDGNELPLPTEAILEISNNSAAGCRFKFADGWTEILPDVDPTPTTDDKGNLKYLDIWGGDVVEFRYPEDLFDVIENEENEFSEAEVNAANRIFNGLKNEVRTLWNWVASTDTTTATNNPFESPKTYNEKNSDGSIIYYDADTVEYRKAKFKNEYTQYFEPQSLLYNYLFTDRYLMIDNRAKNTFLHTVDGVKWDLCFDYDNDTSLGCDNRGTLKYEYYYEDIDKFGSEDVYNAADSVLWCNVRDCLFNELQAAYKNNSFYTAKGTIDDFNEYQSYKPERLEMFDMRRKYIRPYTDGHYASNVKAGKVQSYIQYLPMLNGRKKYQRKAFEIYREAYVNSKYDVVDDSKALSFRAKAPEGSSITVTPYCWLYVHVDYDGPDFGPVRTEANQPRVVTFPLSMLNDTNTHIYHPEWIKAVDGLDQWYIRNANFDAGTRLTKLILGSDAPGYENKKEENHTISIANATLLEELNVCGWKMPNNWDLNLSTNTNLKKLHATNANISSVSFAKGGLLEEVKIDSFSALSAINLKNLKTFEVKSLTPVTKLRIENTPIISAASFLEQCNNLLRLRLIGIDWTVANTQLLDRFIDLPGIDENGFDLDNKDAEGNILPGGSVVAGKVYTNHIKESQLIKFTERWPNLAVDYPNNGLEKQYLVSYYDYDGITLLYETYVTIGELPIDPVEQNLIPTPTRESSISTNYTFSGWDGDFNSVITSSRTFIAKYDEQLRLYTVTWWKDESKLEKLHTVSCPYGHEAVFNDLTTLAPYKDPIAGKNSYIIFTGWDKSTGCVKGDIDVFAQWDNGYVEWDSYPEEKREWTAAQLYTVAQRNTILDFFAEEDGSPNGDRIQIQLGRSFNYTNLTSKKLINEPMKFDGTNYFDTEYKLFEEDKDWTLLIDAQFVESTNYEAVLASCYLENSGFGLKLKNGKYSKAHCIEWCGSSTTQASFVTREVFVIRHKQNSNYIDLFEGKCDELEPSKIQLYNATIRKPNVSLTLGAQKNSNGRYTNYAKGIVHRCEIWEGLLGDSDCKDLVNWPYEKMEFDVVDFGGYSYGFDGDNPTRIDLFASQLTWTRIPAYKGTNVEYGFHTSYIKQWLNERFFKALPVDWQAIIKSPYVTANSLNISTNEKTQKIEQTKFWIPAKSELSDDDWVVGDEFGVGSYKKIYTTDYNRRITRGISTVDVYSEDADWVYRQSTDPSLTKTIKNGSIWINSNTLQIYYNGFWFNWGNEYTIRSIGDSQSSLVQYFIQSGMSIGGSRTYTGSIMPCFSI